VFGEIGARNAPTEQMFWVCGAKSRDDERGTVEVGGRKFQSVEVDLSTFSGVVLTGSAVVAKVTIAKDGSTKEVELVRGVHPDVDSAFLDALRQWRYEAPLEDGKPVEVTYFQTLRTKLQ